MTLNNARTVVYIPLPKFRRDRSHVDCLFFRFLPYISCVTLALLPMGK